MPEGHVIHRIATTLDDLFAGRRLAASSPQGRFAQGARLLDGAEFLAASAHGKHLFGEFADAVGSHHLHVHLGLYGAWRFTTASATDAAFEAPEPRGAVRLRLAGERAVADLNGPMTCRVITAPEVEAVRRRLGPDPLRSDGSPEPFVAKVQASRRAVGELLMDQSVIAGIGNIYRVELLFRHRLHPATPGNRIATETLLELWDDAVELMTDGMREGVILTTDPGDRPDTDAPEVWATAAERAAPDEADIRWYVYRRTGRPCHRCGTPIAATTVANRNVYWCPGCTPPTEMHPGTALA